MGDAPGSRLRFPYAKANPKVRYFRAILALLRKQKADLILVGFFNCLGPSAREIGFSLIGVRPTNGWKKPRLAGRSKGYQLAFFMPGIFPSWASFRSMIREIPNLR